MKLVLVLCLLSTSVFAQEYLKAEDQKYYKNDIMEGNNQRERIDMNVKEINKMHGLMAGMRAEIDALKAEVEELKKKK